MAALISWRRVAPNGLTDAAHHRFSPSAFFRITLAIGMVVPMLTLLAFERTATCRLFSLG